MNGLPAGRLASTAHGLRRAAAGLADWSARARSADERLDAVVGALFGGDAPWQGPAADGHHAACGAYADAIAALADVLAHVAALNGDLATVAGLLADELATAQRARDAAAALPDPIASAEAVARAETRIAELGMRWRYRAVAAAEELAVRTAQLQSIADAVFVAPGGLDGAAPFDLGVLARYAALAEVAPAAITPDGRLAGFVADRVAGIDASPLGAMHFDVIETIDDRGAHPRGNDHVSDADLETAIGEPERTAARVRAWADDHGFEFDEPTIAYLAADVAVTAAAMRLAGRTGSWERRSPEASEAQRADVLAAVAALPGGVAVALLAINGDPAVSADWWRQASPSTRAAAAAGQWRVVGNLDGLPAAVRDEVNRRQLDRDIVELGRRSASRSATEPERRANLVALETHTVLAELAASEDPFGGEVVVQLYAYVPHAFGGDGAVAVVLGDLDEATQVAVAVSGFGSDASGLAADRTTALYDEARWAGEGATVAVVHWQGYDAPSFSVTAGPLDVRANGVAATVDELGDLVSVVNRHRAEAGAALLAAMVDGVRAMRDEQPRVTVVANSYGSTTAFLAADHHELAADALVVTGSPGAGDAIDVAALALPADAVYVLSASTDVVSYFGQTGGGDPVAGLVELVGRIADVELMGRDPAAAEFGATRLAAEHPERSPAAALTLGDVVHVEIGADVDGHDHYYDRSSESLYNIAAVIAGRDDLLLPAAGRWGEHEIDLGSPVRLGFDPRDVSFGWHLLAGPWRSLGELFVDWDARFFEVGLPTDPERERSVTVGLSHAPPGPLAEAAAAGAVV